MLLLVLRAVRSREDWETQYPRMKLTFSNVTSALKVGFRNRWGFLLEMEQIQAGLSVARESNSET